MIFLAKGVAGECDRPAGVFFLDVAVEIGGIADLGLHFLLAVSVIVVGQDGDDDSLGGAAGDFERHAVVVFFLLVLPAHLIPPLPLGSVGEMGQAEFFLGVIGKMRSQDHAAGVAGPVLDIEAGIVAGKKRIAAVAEDHLDEIEIADQRAGGEEAHFHGLILTDSGNRGTDDGAKQQRYKRSRRLIQIGGERQFQKIIRRADGAAEEFGEDTLGHGALVSGHGKSAFGDVKGPLRRAAVAARIVQDAVAQAIGFEHAGGEFVSLGRQRKLAGQAGFIQYKSGGGQARLPGKMKISQMAVEIFLDAAVGRAAMLAEEAGLFTESFEEVAGDAGEFAVAVLDEGQTLTNQFEIGQSEQSPAHSFLGGWNDAFGLHNKISFSKLASPIVRRIYFSKTEVQFEV